MDVVDDIPIVMPPREALPFRLTSTEIDDVVKAINYQRSFAPEWSPWNRAAFWTAVSWVLFVAAISWFGPEAEFNRSVGRALAPFTELYLMATCVGMIWFGDAVHRALGWAFLAFFVLCLPIFRIAMVAYLR